MASFFRNPPRTYSRKGKTAVASSIPAPKERTPLSDQSMNKEGRIDHEHLFSSSDNLESSSSFSRPKRQTRTAKAANACVNKENDSTLDTDLSSSRKRKGSSDESSFDLSGCLSRAKELRAKKRGSNSASQKVRALPSRTNAQPTRASQRTKTATERKRKPTVKETVNTTDEFEKPKAKRLKKSTSKTNVSTVVKPAKSKKPTEPPILPDFKDFEDYELAVETTVNISPEKAAVNLLSPLRENSWENLVKTDSELKTKEFDSRKTNFAESGSRKISFAESDSFKIKFAESDCREVNLADSDPVKKSGFAEELEETKDYSHRTGTSASSICKSETNSSSESDAGPKPSAFESIAPVSHRNADRSRSSPLPSVAQQSSISSRSRSLHPQSSSTSSPAERCTADDDASAPLSSSAFSREEEKKPSAPSASSASLSIESAPPISNDFSLPSSDRNHAAADVFSAKKNDATTPPPLSIGEARESVAQSIDVPAQRVISFPTPRRQEELQDFSRISFCSPMVAGNLSMEDGPEIPAMGLRVNHLRRVTSQTSTSTPLQNMQKAYQFINDAMAPGSPIVHTSMEKHVSSPVWNNVTRRRRFERNRSSGNKKDSPVGDSSLARSRASGSPIPVGARNRQRRNGISNSSTSLQESKLSVDLFDASNSAFEPSLKVVKEIPGKLSLSHIVEESGESLKFPPPMHPSGRQPSNVTSRTDHTEGGADYEIEDKTDVYDAISNTKFASTAKTDITEMAKVATGIESAESILSSIAPSENRSHDDDDVDKDGDRTRRLNNLDLLSPGFVGRGSVPNFHDHSSIAALWMNHSCPDLGRQRPFDFLIEILIDGEPHMIGCHAEDDPAEVAREFIAENNIDPEQLQVLAEFIAEHFRSAQRVVKEKNEKIAGLGRAPSGSGVSDETDAEETTEEKEQVEISVATGSDRAPFGPDETEEKDKADIASSPIIALGSDRSVILNLSDTGRTDRGNNDEKETAERAGSSQTAPGGSVILDLIDFEQVKAEANDYEDPHNPPLSDGSIPDDKNPPRIYSPEEDQSSVSGKSRIAAETTSPGEPDGVAKSPLALHGEREEISISDVSGKTPLRAAACEDEITGVAYEAAPSMSLSLEPVAPSVKVQVETSSVVKETFGSDQRATISLDRRNQIENSRRGSRLSLMTTKSRLSTLEALISDDRESTSSSSTSSSDRRMSRLLRNGKTFLDTSPVKHSPPPLPPTMTLLDVVTNDDEESTADAPPYLPKSTDLEAKSNSSTSSVFKIPQLPAAKPKAAVRRSARASTSRANASNEEKETRRRSIARNLRKSKKIVFSPEGEILNDRAGGSVQSSASPVLGRKVDRRATMAAGIKEESLPTEGRRATVMMTPIQKLAQWRRESIMSTPLSMTKSTTPSAVPCSAPSAQPTTVSAAEGPPFKAARSLRANFETVVTTPVPSIGIPTSSLEMAASDAITPVVVLERLSSEEISDHLTKIIAPAAPVIKGASLATPIASAAPATPAWRRAERLLASPVVVLSPLVRHLRPAVLESSIGSPLPLARDESLLLNESLASNDARSRVLDVCSQATELSFYDVYPKTRMAAMKKIGEGTYGEVYLSFDETTQLPVALKVIPIEGEELVNDERQKTYAEMLSEAVITKEMSELGESGEDPERNNVTSGFIRVNKICAFRGSYPPELLKKWDEWGRKNKSWNDRPDFFEADQLFLVFEFSEGGSDLEKFKFVDPRDALSVFEQTMIALAVGEAELEFEHRDLHWGNILIKKLEAEERIEYALDGVRGEMRSGVRVAIIDFTLSRLKRGGLTQFTDLADDPDIFNGVGEEAGKGGDYQFDCYRLMQEETGNEWKSHAPKTNVIWLHYLAKKLLGKLSSMTKKQRMSANWKRAFEKLALLQRELPRCDGVADVVSLVEKL